ncbi:MULTISPECIES: hypothetical protein [unclassified Roseovarius]|uniref:hypothetical protein n=1 Tax=unclassified Roseovarius TaxID=2614913 RepID=UPI00273E8BFA|nr:hypothetical protein [Roseovarius sp. MMSF_3350]
MTEETPFRHESIWHMIAAPTVWTLHFAIIYAITAVECSKIGTPDLARLSILGLTVLALALICWIAWRAWVQWDYLDDQDYVHDKPTVEARREFLGHAGFLLSIASAIGVIFVAMPALFIETCL